MKQTPKMNYDQSVESNIDVTKNICSMPSHALLSVEIFHGEEDGNDNGILEGIIPIPLENMIQKERSSKRKKPHQTIIPNVNHNSITDRLVGTLHMPLQIPKIGKDKKDTRVKCGICSAKTTIRCSHCNVGMCIADRDGRNCWREFHTREVLEYTLPKTAMLETNDRNMRIPEIMHIQERNQLEFLEEQHVQYSSDAAFSYPNSSTILSTLDTSNNINSNINTSNNISNHIDIRMHAHHV